FQQIKPNGGAAPAGKPPIDVASRLAAMRFGGAGDASVHHTQLAVTASLLRGGMSVEMAGAEVLESTPQGVGGGKNTEKWNWRREKRALSRMCRDFIVKNPELTYLLPDKPTSESKSEKAEAGTIRPRPTVRLEDFYAHMPQHNYIFTPSCELWPASSI